MATILHMSEKALSDELSLVIEKHGFISVLSMLEVFASDNADIIGQNWETIRQNLENSIKEIEEFSIGVDYN